MRRNSLHHTLAATLSLPLLTPAALPAGELFQIGGIRPIARPVARPVDDNTIRRVALPIDSPRVVDPVIKRFGHETEPGSGQTIIGLDVELPPNSLARLQGSDGEGWKDLSEERYCAEGSLQFRSPAHAASMLYRVTTRPMPVEAEQGADGLRFQINGPVSVGAFADYLGSHGIHPKDDGGELSQLARETIEPTDGFQSIGQIATSGALPDSAGGIFTEIHEDKPYAVLPKLQVFDESIPGLTGSRTYTIFDDPYPVFGFTPGTAGNADRIRWEIFDEESNLVKSGSTTPGWLNLFSVDFGPLAAETPNTPRDFWAVIHEEANGTALGSSNWVHIGVNRLPFGQAGELRLRFRELICHMTTSGAGSDDALVDVFRFDLGDPTFAKVTHVKDKDRPMDIHETLEVDTSISMRSQSSGSHFGDVLMMIVVREQDGFSTALDTPQMEHTLGAIASNVSQSLPNRMDQIMANLTSHIRGIADNDNDELIGIRFAGVSRGRVEELAEEGLMEFNRFMHGDDSTYEAKLQLFFDPQ